MEPTGDVVAPHASQGSSRSPGPSQRRGGKRRGRDGGKQAHTASEERPDHHHPTPGGRGGLRPRGRGHGSLGGSNSCAQRVAAKGKAPVLATQEGGQARLAMTKPSQQPSEDEDADAEVCFICASPVQHTAVAPCNHRSCHICSIRMRALYKTKACAHCRTESDHIVLTDDAEKTYQEFTPADFFKSDDNLGMHFENAGVFDDTRLLLQYNCPDGNCDVACLGWPDLHRHVKTLHHKVMCDLCTRNKKVFTHEHELFTAVELQKHQRYGDDNPGAADQSGFKGHPECGFCSQRFYGDDELYLHCRDKHERCHICDRRDGSRQQQYYVNYHSLEMHFKKEHFLCPDRECLEKKFVVFDSDMDLKAHQLEIHPSGLSKDALRDARRVDMSGFHWRLSREEELGSSRREERRREGGRGRGRGRDPNAEPIPTSSAQPMSRAELAYQRQIEAEHSRSLPGRSFGGRLTATPAPREAVAARVPATATEPSTVTASRPVSASTNHVANGLIPLSVAQPARTSTPPTPQAQARLLRHTAVSERAAGMLRKNERKVEEFRSQISAYHRSQLSATQLIDGFFALFDTDSKEMGKLINELAELFEVAAKREGLLQAWNDWKAINEDYPSLPGSATEQALRGRTAAHGGSRVLTLKNSTAQSSRSSANRQASWSSASSRTALPAPPAAAGRVGAKPGQTPWASSSSSAASSRASPMVPRPAPSANVSTEASSTEAFPALPTAPKPSSTLFSPGYTGLGLRRDPSGRHTPVNNVWSGPSRAGSAGTVRAAEEGGAAAGKKKNKQNKKQTLFQWG